MSQRILFVVNVPGFLLSHRLPLALAARDAGFDVHIATGPGHGKEEIAALGFEHHLLPLTRSGLNPLDEMRALLSILALFRRTQPDVVHLISSKPVLYGGIAARITGVPRVIAAIAGMGFVHSVAATGWRYAAVRSAVKFGYRLALRNRRATVIVQNLDDRSALAQMGAIDRSRVVLIRGSGADLTRFSRVPEPVGVPVVCFAARLIRTKGVLEFVAAARALRRNGFKARFVMVGDRDPENPASITELEYDAIRREGVVELLGHRNDIPEIFGRSHIVVLPSYHSEGLPKVLMEAAASGRPVITTDWPGCRDAVIAGVTGELVPPRDVDALARVISELVEDPVRRERMGISARQFAERDFGIEGVVASHLALYLGSQGVSSARPL